jgi:hypothetical protein
VKGKQYPIQARDVQQLCGLLEDKCGINATHQQVLYQGKVLDKNSFFEEIGLLKGDVVEVIDDRASNSSRQSQDELIRQAMKGLQKQDPFELMEQLITDKDFEKMLEDEEEMVHFPLPFS